MPLPPGLTIAHVRNAIEFVEEKAEELIELYFEQANIFSGVVGILGVRLHRGTTGVGASPAVRGWGGTSWSTPAPPGPAWPIEEPNAGHRRRAGQGRPWSGPQTRRQPRERKNRKHFVSYQPRPPHAAPQIAVAVLAGALSTLPSDGRRAALDALRHAATAHHARKPFLAFAELGGSYLPPLLADTKAFFLVLTAQIVQRPMTVMFDVLPKNSA